VSDHQTRAPVPTGKQKVQKALNHGLSSNLDPERNFPDYS